MPQVEPTTEHIPSSGGAVVALHYFGGEGPPLILCHATGFHGHCYRPMLPQLTKHFEVWTLDFRGHGASTIADDDTFAWSGYGDDLVAVIDHLGVDSISAFGHSMGGTAIMLAEQQRPGIIAKAWVFEPIILPTGLVPDRSSMMADNAAKRRRHFPSRAAALQRYASRPPLGLLRADALYAYVEHGFHDADDGVTLACAPETEAETFRAAATHANDIEGLDLHITIAAGATGEQMGPAHFVAGAIEVLPNAVRHDFSDVGHFGPLRIPDRIAEATAEFLRS